MAEKTPCPSLNVLGQFATGDLPESKLAEIRQHVDGCMVCQRLARILPKRAKAKVHVEQEAASPPASSEESFTVPLKKAAKPALATPAAIEDDSTLDAQSVAGPEKRAVNHDATRPLPAIGSPTPESASSDSSSDEISLAFLAPPKKPDELGRLGPYRVLKLLGQGGMGMVFKAEDPMLERLVALKIMKPDRLLTSVARQRFAKEAKAAASIQHKHIVPIYQVGEDRGVPYLAMQFLPGESLDNRLQRDGALPTAEVIRIARETAEGLAAAHERNLIHRDIKPANIWLEEHSPDEPAWVRILDFGLARALGDNSKHLTQSGVVVGTPGYMAPEQAKGGHDIDARCDLFSLGCVMYHMCTGREPFHGDDVMSTLMMLALEQPTPMLELNPELPAGLVEVVNRLLEKDPAKRIQSARATVFALANLEQGKLAVTPAPIAPAARDIQTDDGEGDRDTDPEPEADNRLNDRLEALGLVATELNVPEARKPKGTQAKPRRNRDTPAEKPSDRKTKDIPVGTGLCPQCGKKLNVIGWCLSCGYAPQEEGRESGEPVQEPLKLGWIYALFIGTACVAGISFAIRWLLPFSDYYTLRLWLGWSELILGGIIIILAHLWLLMMSLPHRNDNMGIMDYFDPTSLYYYSFSLLPATAKPFNLAIWGLTATLCALFVVGGIFSDPGRRRINQGEGNMIVNADLVRAGDEPEDDDLLARDGDGDTGNENRYSDNCTIVGYVFDADGNVIGVVTAIESDGQYKFAGVVSEFESGVDDDFVRKLKAEVRADPVAADLKDQVKASGTIAWTNPKVKCEVTYAERDPSGLLRDPVIKAVPKKPATEP